MLRPPSAHLRTELLVVLALLAAITLTAWATPLDLAAARLFHAPCCGWPLSEQPFWRLVYRYGVFAGVLLGAASLVLLTLTYWYPARLHRWRRPALFLVLVVAFPSGSLEILGSRVRGLGLGIAAAALLLALLTAFVMAGRLARPVHQLAEAAGRVAAGDLSGEVQAATSDEIGDMARAFNSMTAELRASRERLLQAERVAAWREMAQRLAHELKNPIFPIQLSIETLRRAFGQQEAGKAGNGRFQSLFLEASDTILAELRALRQIIDEFSQFARMPHPRLAATDVNAVLAQALDLYRPRAGAVAIETSLAPDLPQVPADRDLLGRAFGNLLSNALDAMPEGGTLRVRTVAAPGSVRVEIEDTGPGLQPEQTTRLFTPYYTTKKGGTGLGLAIVQGIVSDHGGRVEVHSEPGQGTVFALVLPA
jgi:nitrogen fixation/metabolism regulation signal transduction histidine kinase